VMNRGKAGVIAKAIFQKGCLTPRRGWERKKKKGTIGQRGRDNELRGKSHGTDRQREGRQPYNVGGRDVRRGRSIRGLLDGRVLESKAAWRENHKHSNTERHHDKSVRSFMKDGIYH